MQTIPNPAQPSAPQPETPCCSTQKQATCCEPAEKTTCCAPKPAGQSGCGCQ